MNTELKHVLSQIKWADGISKKCEPYTPTISATEAYKKLRGIEKIRWGCKVNIVWQDDVDFSKEEFGPEWEENVKNSGDTGYIIAIPGYQSSCPTEGVVWCPELKAEKGGGEPVWMQLQVLLASPYIAWVEVV